MPPNMPFMKYVAQLRTIEKLFTESVENNYSIDKIVDRMIEEKLFIEDVVSADVAQVTLPLFMSKPKGPRYIVMSDEGKAYIEKYKAKFKKIYGDIGEDLVNYFAYKRFG